MGTTLIKTKSELDNLVAVQSDPSFMIVVKGYMFMVSYNQFVNSLTDDWIVELVDDSICVVSFFRAKMT
jgi:hypothetical protein